jgi:ABC-type sugar transport system substrate-binding protein
VKVLEISGSSASLVSQDRHAGFAEEMAQAFQVELRTLYVEEGTRDGAEDLLLSLGPELTDIDYIFAHTDYLGLGAFKAVTALGLDQIKLVSIDGFQIPDGGLDLLARVSCRRPSPVLPGVRRRSSMRWISCTRNRVYRSR